MYITAQDVTDKIIAQLSREDVEFKENIAYTIISNEIEELQLYILILMADSGCEITFFAFHAILEEFRKVRWFYKLIRLELAEHINNLELRTYGSDFA
jgi:hypothetical protein